MAQQPGPYYQQQMQQQHQLPQFYAGVNKLSNPQSPSGPPNPPQNRSGQAWNPPPIGNTQQAPPPINGSTMKPSASYPVMTNGNTSNFSSRTSSPGVFNDPRSPQLQPPAVGQLQASGSVLTPPKTAFGVASPLNSSTPNMSPNVPVGSVTTGMQQMNINKPPGPLTGSNLPPQFSKVVGLPATAAAPSSQSNAINNNFPGQRPPQLLQQPSQQSLNGNTTPLNNRMPLQVNGNPQAGLLSNVPPPQQNFQYQAASAPPTNIPNGPTTLNKRPMYPQQPLQQQQQQQHQQSQQPGYNGFNAPTPDNRLQYQNQQPNIVQSGFNRIWGQDTVDLLQNRRILPVDKVTPPLIKLNHQFHEAVNCSPDIFRCTLNKVPESNSLLQKSRLPMGILIHPFRDLNVRFFMYLHFYVN